MHKASSVVTSCTSPPRREDPVWPDQDLQRPCGERAEGGEAQAGRGDVHTRGRQVSEEGRIYLKLIIIFT